MYLGATTGEAVVLKTSLGLESFSLEEILVEEDAQHGLRHHKGLGVVRD